MAVKKLTQLMVDRLGPSTKRDKHGKPTHEVFFDTLLPGFGVRVSPKGKKSWLANCRVRGELKPTTLASYAMVPSIADARELARKAMLEGRQGINPIDARRAKAAETKAASEAEKAQERANAYTFTVLCNDYCDFSAAKHRETTAKETRGLLLNRLIPRSGLGPRPAAANRAVLEDDIRRYANALKPGAVGEKGRSNEVRMLATAYKWAMRTGRIPKGDNPAAVDVPARGGSRDRVLTDPEIVALWHSTFDLGWPFGPAFRFMLLTGQRRKEVCEMPWAELADIDNSRWVIPGPRTKNHKPNIVHLHRLAVDILRGLPRFHGSPYVFTTIGVRPVSGFGWATVRLRQHMAKRLGVPALDKNLTLHDLRRTLATNMRRLGVGLEVTEGILNHRSGTRSGIVAVYQHWDFAEDRVAALEKWGDWLEWLVSDRPPVTLRSA